jgi:Reverse transcriptase (RNA-dependent DNA polymerase)
MFGQPPRNNETAYGHLENGREEGIAISIDGRLKNIPSASCVANRNGRRNRNRGHGANVSMSFVTGKERADQELSIQLRKQGKITTPGAPFEASDKQEIDNLIGREVFSFEQYDPAKHGGIRIFKSRLVREIKGKATNAPYEKSRLVVQGYQDDGKEMILTQSPTIQRASQRVIAALAPSLVQLQDRKMDLWLRDISQAYVQSTTKLNRTILARLPEEIQHRYPEGTIMVVVRPLYGIAEAGTHWWATYSKHHKDKLLMTTSTYDPCLLITTTENGFGVVGMQTDDTIILADERFSALEENELVNAKFTAKPKEKLTPDSPLIFNGCVLTQNGSVMSLRQKEQGKKISIEQRARGAYIASICQPEAAFDLSVAAQHQEPTKDDVVALNKRLKWQLEHLDRGLTYIPLDVSTAKLFVFVDGSFANNKDYSSQIGYEIILANEITGHDEFTINGNLIHWSSTKSKRVTRSVLASEIYGMVGGVDMSHAIGSTLSMVMRQLGLPATSVIVCTDSYSLYECLVKLGTTKEKRLMIDVMAIRESYENRELFEIRWINGNDNPADAMTKSNPNKALETFIDTNSLRIRVEGWVKRSP